MDNQLPEEIDDGRDLVTIDWRELGKGREAYPLHPDMLSDGGHEVAAFARLKGESLSTPKREFVVRYDRSFAVEKLSKQLRLIARSIEMDDFTNFFEQIWRDCNVDQGK